MKTPVVEMVLSIRVSPAGMPCTLSSGPRWMNPPLSSSPGSAGAPRVTPSKSSMCSRSAFARRIVGMPIGYPAPRHNPAPPDSRRTYGARTLRLEVVSRSLLAVHAHPDDESLTMAGTLAYAVAAGADVTLVTATLGEQGEVIGDDLQGLVADRADQLGGYRLTELRAACAALGITDHRLLGGIGT